MTRLRIKTPSRLHFGLLGWGPHSTRQFGGLGLMIDEPGIELEAESSASWQAEGPLASRALEVAERISDRLADAGTPPPAARLVIRSAPNEHIGLGVGTQLSLAVTRVLWALAGRDEPPIRELANLSGRGLRSGIGLHGFERGGLIVDGGRGPSGSPPPLLAHYDFPEKWGILVVMPSRLAGLHGSEEIQAFSTLPPIPEATTDRLCSLLLLGLLPALIDRDIASFGVALAEIQRRVGECFAPAQGGIFANPEVAAIVDELQQQGLHGVGQSSWGPTLYGFSDEPEARRGEIIDRLRARLGLDAASLFWTRANLSGAMLEWIET